MEIKLGAKVQTPRFLTVRIAAIFESLALARDCGFVEPTHLEDENYEISGKSLGQNRMVFAAMRKPQNPMSITEDKAKAILLTP